MRTSFLSIICMLLCGMIFSCDKDEPIQEFVHKDQGSLDDVTYLKQLLESPYVYPLEMREGELSDSDTTYWCNYGEILAIVHNANSRFEEFDGKDCFLVNLTDDCPWHLDYMSKLTGRDTIYRTDATTAYPNYFKNNPYYYVGVVNDDIKDFIQIGNVIRFLPLKWYRTNVFYAPKYTLMVNFRMLYK